MIKSGSLSDVNRRVWQAVGLWGVFVVFAVILNGTVPFVLGSDVHAWTYSITKDFLFHIIVYASLFLIAPLVLVKGWPTVRQPSFFVPLLIATAAIILRPFARASVSLVVVVVAYLHWRFDLSDLGIRSHGWKSDAVAILFLGLMNFIPVMLRPGSRTLTLGPALLAGVDRLFANSASTAENLFYFGFLTERLSLKTGRWLTAILVGLMYTVHEMTNPEYWYEGVSFIFVFAGIAITAAVYLWRCSTIVVWLSDGLGKLVMRLV